MTTTVSNETEFSEDELNTKVCGTCKEPKPFSEFYKHNTNVDGLFTDCKKCVLKKRRDKYAARKNRDSSKLDRVQQFIQGYRDPSELADDEVIGSFIRDDNGVPVRSAELRERYLAKFNKELSRRVNDFLREKTPRAVEIVFEIANNDLYEPADRFKAATWLAERVIGKTPEVLLTGKTDAPYIGILDNLESGSREDYRARVASFRPDQLELESGEGYEGIEDAEFAELEELEDAKQGLSSRNRNEDRDSGPIRNSVSNDAEQTDESRNHYRGSMDEDSGDDQSVLGHVESIEEQRRAKKEQIERIKKAKQRRYAARATGASSLSRMPWLADFSKIKGTTNYRMKLIPPEFQTQLVVDRIMTERPWFITEEEVIARRAEAADEAVEQIRSKLERLESKRNGT